MWYGRANDLAVLLLFFETIPREKRINVLTAFNLASAVATSAGSLLGGALLLALGTTGQIYLLLFALSAVARAAALTLLLRCGRKFGRDDRSQLCQGLLGGWLRPSSSVPAISRAPTGRAPWRRRKSRWPHRTRWSSERGVRQFARRRDTPDNQREGHSVRQTPTDLLIPDLDVRTGCRHHRALRRPADNV